MTQPLKTTQPFKTTQPLKRSKSAVQCHDLAEQHRRTEIGATHQDGRHRGIGRFETNIVLFRIEILDRCLVTDECDHDIASICTGLLAYEDVVAVEDTG